MKLLISVDMEGISGVTGWHHVLPEKAEYQRGRKWMTADVNAAIRGAVDAGVDEIIVSDGHWAEGMPGVIRKSARIVEFTTPDVVTANKAFRSMVGLANV